LSIFVYRQSPGRSWTQVQVESPFQVSLDRLAAWASR
jgi:hypothetical protein